MKKGMKRNLIILGISWIFSFVSLMLGMSALLAIATFILLIALLIFFGSIIIWIKDKKAHFFVYSSILLLVIISGFVSSYKFVTYQEKENLSRSKIVINALEKYKHENGQYPERLEDLIPKYLEKIPYSFYSVWYDRPSKTRFTIEFGRPIMQMYRYDSDLKHWVKFD